MIQIVCQTQQVPQVPELVGRRPGQMSVPGPGRTGPEDAASPEFRDSMRSELDTPSERPVPGCISGAETAGEAQPAEQRPESAGRYEAEPEPLNPESDPEKTPVNQRDRTESPEHPELDLSGLAFALQVGRVFGQDEPQVEEAANRGGLAALARAAWGQGDDGPDGLGVIYKTTPVRQGEEPVADSGAPAVGQIEGKATPEPATPQGPAVAPACGTGGLDITPGPTALPDNPSGRTKPAGGAVSGPGVPGRGVSGAGEAGPAGGNRDGPRGTFWKGDPTEQVGRYTARVPSGHRAYAAAGGLRFPGGNGIAPGAPQAAVLGETGKGTSTSTDRGPVTNRAAGKMTLAATALQAGGTTPGGGSEGVSSTGAMTAPAAASIAASLSGPAAASAPVVAGTPGTSVRPEAHEAYQRHDTAGSPRELVSRVVAKARLLRGQGGSGTLEIQLQPASLGRVYMRLSSGSTPGGAIQLLLRAERRQVAEALRQGATELVQALEGQGLRVGSINVSNFKHESGSWPGADSTGGFGTWPGGRGMSEGNAPGLYRTAPDSADTAAPQGESTAGGMTGVPGWGTGGWLNVFA